MKKILCLIAVATFMSSCSFVIIEKAEIKTVLQADIENAQVEKSMITYDKKESK